MVKAELIAGNICSQQHLCMSLTFLSLAEPEVQTFTLTSEDEFLVLACDGLWDVMSSQRCMELARTHLRDNNDPQLCAEHLVSTTADAVPLYLPLASNYAGHLPENALPDAHRFKCWCPANRRM